MAASNEPPEILLNERLEPEAQPHGSNRIAAMPSVPCLSLLPFRASGSRPSAQCLTHSSRKDVTASSVNARGRSDAIKSAESESDGTARGSRPDPVCTSAHALLVALPLGKALYESGDMLRHIHCRRHHLALYVLKDGSSAEIAVVGNDGARLASRYSWAVNHGEPRHRAKRRLRVPDAWRAPQAICCPDLAVGAGILPIPRSSVNSYASEAMVPRQ
jgi:hypothetical protein